MIAIRGLALAAVAGASAIAFAPRTTAEPDRETFTLEIRYDATRPALDNYLAFARQIEKACELSGARGLDIRTREQACARETMDQLVARMGRTELAGIHDLRIGRHADSSRTLAVR